ncbi:MAG: Na+/H+ antiporter NhaA [Mucilaginibacter sp.]
MAKFARIKRAFLFIEHPAASGIVLLGCVVLSLLIANSPLSVGFNQLISLDIAGASGFTLTSTVNDGLMAIFFLMAGLEIKREIVEGQLSGVKKAALPVLCAAGGMIVPAVVYYLFNHSTATHAGWGIPMATDIAFAVAILNALKKVVPPALRVFLTALAIVDDLGAIIVIAIFYTAELHTMYLYYTAGLFALMLVFNYLNLKNIWFYLLPGIVMWYCIHHSGVHATVAGVLTAFAIPARTRGGYSPLTILEHQLSNPVNFLILPLFALANTNITYTDGMLGGLITPLGLGIVAGLLLGKPLGILLLAWGAVKSKLSMLPDGINWAHMTGMGLLAGIGFTMSIFIALLSFNDLAVQSGAKFAILIASVIAAVSGYVLLNFYVKAK